MPPAVVRVPAASTPQELFRYDPTRKPDWRFRRVLELLEREPRKRRFTEFDDRFVCDMCQIMLARRAGGDGEYSRLASHFPDLAGALAIYDRADSRLRLHLECRILAGQSDEQIADRLGIAPQAVTAYEQLFFNVRDKLKSDDWIRSRVLDSGRRNGVPESERRLKSQAIEAGPIGIEEVLARDDNLTDRDRQVQGLVDRFAAALDNDFTTAQRAELELYINAEKQAETAATEMRNAIATAARQTLAVNEKC